MFGICLKTTIKKNCWSGLIKNVRILIFTRLHFVKKSPVYQKSWYDLKFLRYRVWQTEIGNYGSFFAQKIRILKKWKKHLEMSSVYTCVPKITIVWCMLPELWSATDIFFCHFGLFTPFTWLLTLPKKNWKKCKNTWSKM